jgi:acetyl esterase/lipase
MRFTLKVFLVISMCAAWPTFGADKPLVVEVWPGRAPEESSNIGEEKFRMSPKLDRKQVEVTEQTRLVTNVTKPTLTIYRPAKDKDTGTSMLICPGGGYWDLYWQLEGEEVAAWLSSIGVTGIILKYRVPRRPDEPKGQPEHSVLMYLALKKASILAELHIYATAAHDFGVRPSEHPCSTWTQACAVWLRHQGFLKPPKPPN